MATEVVRKDAPFQQGKIAIKDTIILQELVYQSSDKASYRNCYFQGEIRVCGRRSNYIGEKEIVNLFKVITYRSKTCITVKRSFLKTRYLTS